MEQYIIKGGNPLVGEVDIAGAKNAALAILAAAIMTDDTILIENLPDVRDINVLLEAISGIGAQVERINKSTVKINGSTISDISVDYEYIKKIRASYYLLGALLGKYKHAEVPLPGGCNIGSRPIDQHLNCLLYTSFTDSEEIYVILGTVLKKQKTGGLYDDEKNKKINSSNCISGSSLQCPCHIYGSRYGRKPGGRNYYGECR